MISEKLITNLTKAFDDDGDIIIGNEDELIMIRSGAEGDEYYEITIERVKGEGVDRSYEVLNTISMEKNKTDIMKHAIEIYLENGGSIEFLKTFWTIMSEIIFDEIEVAIKDPAYLEHQNHTKLVSVAKEIIEGKFGEFVKADESDNFKF